ncbi:hypothetical protein DL89DRAFT_290822 [Linderina pennispora]|uniref:RGS domain-containing protein n=1 Tax=Linderina pennispora TaxID=61395 RepID=A0A1Y1WIK2_9FUNG|nr:uncharacterized protein DL89DRAFT_290822 [Linderina pennispora]ORX73046.1 hypothetical protein DL89DRAFT_290822 [Linderina pennispora]
MASDNPAWEAGGSSYKIRVGAVTAICVIYGVFVLVTMAMFLIQSARKNIDLSRRSIVLVTLQAAGAFMVGTIALAHTALKEVPCFIRLWMVNLGFILCMTALFARVVQFIVVSRTHMLYGQLRRSTSVDRTSADSISSEKPLLGDLDVHEMKALPPLQNSVYKRMHRYMKLHRFVSNKALAIFIGAVMLAAIVLTLTINLTNKDYSLKPMSTDCPMYWGMVPVMVIIAIYLLFLNPILLTRVWRMHDAYGIKVDLIVCEATGLIGLVMFLIWELALGDLHTRWSGLFFVWVATVMMHISAVVVPLVRAMKNAHVIRIRMRHGRLPIEMVVSEVEDMRREFVDMLNSPPEYCKFREFTATCFCSEFTAFLDEYQELKIQTILALRRMHEYQEIDIYNVHYPLDKTSFYSDDSNRPPTPIKKCVQSSPTISILGAVRAAFPRASFDSTTQFPVPVMDRLVTIFSMYVNEESYMALNLPLVIIERVRTRLESKDLSLVLLDEVKEEVMVMLYADVFARYRREM